MNNYTPRLTLKQRLQHIRYAKLERELKPLCSWVDFYDYLWSYGSINWENKSVLDVGADIGSSAIFFLSRGAKYVYLIEKEPAYRETYESIKQKHPILKNTYMVSSFRGAKSAYFDVLKMDCEGCELMLLNEELLQKYPEWIIGLHRPQLNAYQFEQKKKLLERHGGNYHGSVNANSKDGSEYVWIKKTK